MQNVALLSKLIYTDVEVNGRVYSQLCELNVSEIYAIHTETGLVRVPTFFWENPTLSYLTTPAQAVIV
jgi:hypothetical protein